MHNRQFKRILAGAVLTAVFLTGCKKSTHYSEEAAKQLDKGEYSAALENYNKAIMEDEELQKAYGGAGIASLKLGDYEKAEEMFVRALKESSGILGDTELNLSYYLGESQMCLGKYEEAAKTYTNVIEVYEDETDAYFYRGSAYLQMDDVKKAEADFKKAAEGQDAAVLYGIYEAYEAKESGSGNAYLEKITALKGTTGAELYRMGQAYAKLGNEEKAMECLEKSKKEKEYRAVFYMGYIQEQKGDYANAWKYYEEYKENVELTFEEYSTISDCAMKSGDYEAALELNRSMRENAQGTYLQNLLFDEIVICEKSSDYAAARSKAEAYVAEYPDDEEGQKEYQFLMTR